MTLEQLWAGWRIPYIEDADAHHDRRRGEVPEGTTLFEAIFRSDLSAEEKYLLWRGDTCFAILNAFPYTSGHVMVLPQRGVARLTDLHAAEHAELWDGVRMATDAIENAYRPHGINVGANLGRGAGAGIPDHLHVHVLPRWSGDTNFMTAVANTRVLPETLADSWRRLVEAWPAS